MPINFTKIFQDSWNFIQNQRQFTLTFIVAFFLSNLFITLMLNLFPTTEITTNSSDELAQVLGIGTVSPNIAILLIAYQLLYLFIASWCLISIHQISQSQHFSLNTTITTVSKRFIGVLLINIILLMPILIGVSKIFFSLIMNKTQPSNFSLLSAGLGIYLFIRFCLTSVHYLIRDVTISQALQTTWKAGIKRTAPLFLYCLIIHFLLPLLIRHISAFSINFIFEIIIDVMTSFLTVFSLIFTYRFYTIFMQKV
ncbi:hypothetical protein K7G91_001057 [Pasteurella canis]|nr:hypothetical protein K7G91_001057 [Pasteurella canis]